MRSIQFVLVSSLVAMTACATGELLDETRGPLASSGGEPGETGGASGSGGASGTGGIPVGGKGADECASNEKLCLGQCTTPFPGVGCGLENCDSCPGTNPENGTIACIGAACGINCKAGYQLAGNECVEAASTGGASGSGGASASGGTKATGGAGGSGGTKATGGAGGTSTGGSKATGGTSGGGSGGTISTGGSKATGGSAGATQCVARNCPECGPILGPQCCTPQNKCGCPIFYIPGTCG